MPESVNTVWTGSGEPASGLTLLLVDQQEHWQRGDRVRVEAYLQRQPALLANAGGILDLVYHEILLREEQGEQPVLAEYLQRFPQFPSQLRLHFEVHRALGAGTPPGSTPVSVSTPSGSPTPGTAVEGPSVPGYELLGVLGRGGMGVVYRARQVRLDRVVALKLLLSGDHAGPQELARFRAEAEAVARLQHPNIVQIHEVGEHAGHAYFSLEYVAGGSLAERLAGSPQPAREAAQLLETVARAVHHAHQRGIVHRDLKPANILLQWRGESAATTGAVVAADSPLHQYIPKITDFGLAKRLDVDLRRTQSGAIVGTPSYMAPEQAGGQTKAIGPAADVYGLGAILYELLTGRPPFRAETPLETLLQVQADEPVPPTRLQPKLPRDLETVCLKCLEKDPRKRYATAEELAEDLRRFLADEPIRARPVSRTERLWRWCRRNPRLASMTALILAVTLAGIGGICWQWQEAEHARGEAIAKAEAEQKARRDQVLTLADMYTSLGLAAAHDDPRQAVLWFAYAARLAGNDQERADANRIRAAAWGRLVIQPVRAVHHPGHESLGRAYRLLAIHPGDRHLLTQALDAPSEETSCQLWDLHQEVALPFPGNPCAVSAAAWDATGERLAVGTPEGEVTICRFPSGEPLQHLRFAGRIISVLFSPDGRYCAVAAADRVRVWDCQQAAFATPELKHPAPLSTLAFHPKGGLLATHCQDQLCRVFAVPTEEDVPLFWPERHGTDRIPPLFLDEGRGLLTLRPGIASWRDPRTGEVLHELRLDPPGIEQAFSALALSGDGKHLVLANGRPGPGKRQVRIFDVQTAQPVSPNLEHRPMQPVWSAAFSPDGQTLLTGSGDRTARLWSVPAGQPLGSPLMHPTSVYRVAFAGDGRHLLTGQRGGLIRLWALPVGNPRDFRVPVGGYSLVRLSRDGRFLLPTGTSHPDAALRSTQVVDLTTGQPVGSPLPANGFLMDAAFAPDGLQVAAAVSCAASAERAAQPGEQPGQLLLWDWRAGQLQHQPLSLASEPRKLDYSPDGRQLAVLGTKGELVVLDPATGKTLWQGQAPAPHRPNYSAYVTNGAVRFGPDNRSLLTQTAGSVLLWDALTGQLLCELEHKGNDVQFSADGRLVATTGTDGVHVWERATGARLASLPHPDWMHTARFSPDGQHLLTACRDGMARLWDWRAGRLVCPPFEHEHEVHAVAFTPDGRHVLSASDDGVLKIWEWHTGKLVCPPLALGGSGLSLAVTPDGRRVACGGFMNELRVFHLDDWLAPATLEPDDLCAWAELVSGQRIEEGGGVTNLTTEEWLEGWRAFRRRHPAFPHLPGDQRLEQQAPK